MQIRNITRVTHSSAPVLDEKLPWRLNAYARMPLARFAQPDALATYLDLHDVTGSRRLRRERATPAAAGILQARIAPMRRVSGEEVILGDGVDVALEDAILAVPARHGSSATFWRARWRSARTSCASPKCAS